MRARKPCSVVGCKALTGGAYCDAHQRQRRAKADARRGTAHKRGYTARWRKARRRFLSEHPLCRECANQEQWTASTVVDHIIPHRGDETLFWDEDNWQALCKPCHDAKTARGE